MKTAYRVLNGQQARGIPKNFSAEERQRRSDRARLLQPKAMAARIAKAKARRDRLENHKQLVRDAASLGVFIPIQDFE